MVVPLVLQLIQPRSVVDVGCGLGAWLRVFQEAGISDIQGVDGPHVDTATLEIPAARFTAIDLRVAFGMARTFDLVLSLEVAEHLPEVCADRRNAHEKSVLNCNLRRLNGRCCDCQPPPATKAIKRASPSCSIAN